MNISNTMLWCLGMTAIILLAPVPTNSQAPFVLTLALIGGCCAVAKDLGGKK